MFRVISEVLKKIIMRHRHLQKSEISGKVSSLILIILHGRFVSRIGLSLDIFGKCVSLACNTSHFSTRHDKLVRKRELA